MTAPDAAYTPDPATCVDQNIVRQVAGPLCRSGVHHSQLDFADVPCAMCVELAEFAVVALVGRLLPAVAETRTEWTWRHNRFIATHEAGTRRTRAERNAATCAANFPGDDVGVVHRTVSTWPDGSTLVGPWLPAPTNTEESA